MFCSTSCFSFSNAPEPTLIMSSIFNDKYSVYMHLSIQECSIHYLNSLSELSQQYYQTYRTPFFFKKKKKHYVTVAVLLFLIMNVVQIKSCHVWLFYISKLYFDIYYLLNFWLYTCTYWLLTYFICTKIIKIKLYW